MIPLFKPYYDWQEEEAVIQVLRSGWTGLGPKTEEFENKFAKSVGAKFGICCNSATSALLIAAKTLGIKPGDEVIVPTITFVSTAHIACLLGAKPVFCDVEPKSLTIDWKDVEKRITKNTKLAIPVLYGGKVIDAPSFDFPLVYDCAHAAGASFDAGNKLCCWSFHAVKNISIGDGGMITTDDKRIYEAAKQLRWLGIDSDTWSRSKNKNYKWEYAVNTIGYKAHGNDLTSSIGLVQLKKLEETKKRRLELVELYNSQLNGVVETPELDETSAWHLYVIKTKNRDELYKYLAENGVATGVHYKPIHLHKCYNYKGSLPVAEAEWLNILTLPLFPALKDEEVVYISNLIKDYESCKI